MTDVDGSPDAQDEGAPATRPPRVLIVDDEPLIRRMLTRVLEADVEVSAASNGAEAFKLFYQGARFDVVLCDIWMPGMNGVELLAAVRQLDPAQAERFAFMTGGSTLDALDAQQRDLPEIRLWKPFRLDKVREVVRQGIEAARKRG